MAERKRKPKPKPEMEQLAQSLIAAMASQQDGYNASDVYETMQEGLKLAMERLMQTELTAFLGYQKSSQEEKPTSNRRNGTTSKTVRSKHGALELNIPRDRNSAFESHILTKHQRDISEIEDKVISMYARGMSDRDISDSIEEIYGFSLSATVIGQMTDAVLPLVKEWQNRPLRKVYPFIFIDALYVDMKVERCSQKRAIYVMIGIDEDGRKDVLGFWNKATEGADEWMKIFDEIQSRGVEKVSFISADGLSGLERAVDACFGKETVFQRCIVHMVRNSLKHLPRSEYAAFCSDIKDVYSAVSLNAALDAFDLFKAKWENGHSKAVKVWTEQFKYVEQLFNYPVEIRRVIYTTNTIESVNSALRKVTNLKGALPSEDALSKLLYLRIQNLLKTWKGPVRFWTDIKKKLDICCPGWNELRAK